MVTPWHKNPCAGGNEKLFIGHHYNIHSLPDLCLGLNRGWHWFSRGKNSPCYPLVQSIFIYYQMSISQSEWTILHESIIIIYVIYCRLQRHFKKIFEKVRMKRYIFIKLVLLGVWITLSDRSVGKLKLNM